MQYYIKFILLILTGVSSIFYLISNAFAGFTQVCIQNATFQDVYFFAHTDSGDILNNQGDHIIPFNVNRWGPNCYQAYSDDSDPTIYFMVYSQEEGAQKNARGKTGKAIFGASVYSSFVYNKNVFKPDQFPVPAAQKIYRNAKAKFKSVLFTIYQIPSK